MYCKNCGKKISKEADIFPKCGVKTNTIDKPSIILNIIALLFPIVGLILYFVWRKQMPNKSKSILTCAIIGWGLGILSYIFA